MLREHPARESEGELQRRWFTDDAFDLYVWCRTNGEVARFQLCYGKPNAEKAVEWRPGGLAHFDVDPGEESPLANRSQSMEAEGGLHPPDLARQFDAAAVEIEPAVRKWVVAVLSGEPAPHHIRIPDRVLPDVGPRHLPRRRRRRVWRWLLGLLGVGLLAMSLMVLDVWSTLRSQEFEAPEAEAPDTPQVPSLECIDEDALARDGVAAARSGAWTCSEGLSGTVAELPRRFESGMWLFSISGDRGTHIGVTTYRDVSGLRTGQRVRVRGPVVGSRPPDWILIEARQVQELDPPG